MEYLIEKRKKLTDEIRAISEKGTELAALKQKAWIKFNAELDKLKGISLMGSPGDAEAIQAQIAVDKAEYERLGALCNAVKGTSRADVYELIKNAPESRAYSLAQELVVAGYRRQQDLEKQAKRMKEVIDVAKADYIESIRKMGECFQELYDTSAFIFEAQKCLPKSEHKVTRPKPRIAAPFPHDLAFDNLEISRVYKRPIL